MAVLAKPFNIFSGQTAGMLTQHRVDAGNAALIVLEARGGNGFLTLETTVADWGRWDPAQYSDTPDGPARSGTLEVGDRTRIYLRGPISGLQINGMVTSGALSLWYFGTPFVQPAGAGAGTSGPLDIDFSPVEEGLDEILAALGSQPVTLQLGGEAVDAFNPLPMTGEMRQGDAGTEEWPVVVGSRTRTISPLSPLSVKLTAYGAGNVVGQLVPFSILRAGHAGGVIESLTLTDLSGQNAQLDLFFFSQMISVAADGAAFAPADQDLLPPTFLGVISIAAADWVAAGAGKSVCTKLGLGLALGLLPNGDTLYAVVVTRGTPTYAKTTALRISLGFLQD